MPIVVAAEVYRLVQVTNIGSMVLMNQFHFGRIASGGSAATLNSDWIANVIPVWRANVHNWLGWSSVSTQRIAPLEDEIVRTTVVNNGAINTGFPLPTVAAGIITWRTQLTGRTHRGRSYIPGLVWGSAQTGDGATWNTTGLTTLRNIGNGILNRYTLGANPGAFYLAVWSRKNGGAFPPRDPAGATMVSSLTAQPYIGSMGSRRYGHGM